ncbi:hypothetical protein CN602_23340 [Bacillus cereus]|nr:hypothetical protein CN602_23340 [Bacillus cereus]
MVSHFIGLGISMPILDGISVFSNGRKVVCSSLLFCVVLRSGQNEFDRIKGIRFAYCYASLRSLFTLPAVTSPPKGDDPIKFTPINEVLNPERLVITMALITL